MLRLRIITALLLGSVLVGIIWLGIPWLFSLFLVFCIFAAAWEWAGLSGAGHVMARAVYGILVVAMMLLLDGLAAREWIDLFVVLGVAWWCIALVIVIAYQQGMKSVPVNVPLKLICGILVLLPSSISLLLLFEGQHGPGILLVFFLLIWLVDSSAYFSGSKFGNHRLASRVSPGKTWEGVIGSLVAATVMAIGYATIKSDVSIPQSVVVLIFLVTAMFSIVGDLFESLLKREAGVKDSGRLLPGHGGVLDRIDSLTAAAPVFLLGISIFGARV